MRKATIGIDIGTSAVKVVAVADDGAVLARASRGYPMKTPRQSFVEQSPMDWWTATSSAAQEVIGCLGNVDAIGVGLSGQLNGFVLLDAGGVPLSDAVIWLDTRAVAEAEDLDAHFGDLLRARAATELSAIAVLAKLAWVARHRPDLMSRAKRVLLVKDFILWRLSGVAATDPSDASSTGMMDATTREWMPELCRAADFDPGILPPIRPSCEVVGHVTPIAAAETGIPAGTPVVAGGGDVAALAVGCGVVDPGILGVTLGTAGHVVLSEKGLPRGGVRPGFWHMTHADPARSIWLGLVMSGGLSLAWLHRMFSMAARETRSFGELVALSADVPGGARGVIFVPFLEGAATPSLAPKARAGFHGLSSSHGAPEMVQAVMEGVTFNVRDCVEMFGVLGGTIGEVRLAEGGARVDRWCQIVANVLERPVVRIEELDASSVGAALMAHVGVSGEPLEAVVGRTVVLGTTFRPDPDTAQVYREAYERYRTLAAWEVSRSRGPSSGA